MKAEPTRDQIVREYAKALAIIDGLRTRNAELLVALKSLLSATPDCEDDFITDTKGNYILKAVGLGTACRDARAAIAKAEGRS